MLTEIINYFIGLATEWSLLLNIPYPWNLLLCVFILSLIFCFLVIIFGFLIQKLKDIVYWLLYKRIGPKLAGFICFRLTFPGTVIHEFSHATFAVLSGAKVIKIQCFSTKKDTLGYLEYQPRGRKIQQQIQHSFTSAAPTIVGIILTPIFLDLAINSTAIWMNILFWYLSICMLLHMNMSDLDIKNYFKGLPVIFVLLFIINYFLVKINLSR